MQKKRNQLIYHLALGYLVTWMIAPPLSYGTVFRVIAILCFGIFILRKLIYNDNHFRFYAVIGGLLIAYSIFLSLMYDTSVTAKFGFYIFICTASCASFLLSRWDVSSYYWIIPYAMLLFILFNILSLREIAIDPGIMRSMSKNTADSAYYASRGVGGYGYVYALLSAIPFGVDIALAKTSSLPMRLISIIFVVSSYILEWQSAYFMALLLSIIIIPLYMVMRVENRSVKIVLFVLIMLLAIISFLYLDSIVDFLIERVQIPGIRRKLIAGYDILTSEASIEDSEFLTRYQRYIRDIQLIKQYPIWGSLTRDGNHSFILDLAARYGLPYMIAVLLLLWQPLRLRGQKRGGVANTSIVTVFLFFLFNAFAFSIGSILYILLPIYSLTKYQPDDDYEEEEEVGEP